MNYNTGANEQSFLIFPLWLWVILICLIIAQIIGLSVSKDRKKYDSPKTWPWWWWLLAIFVWFIVFYGTTFSN